MLCWGGGEGEVKGNGGRNLRGGGKGRAVGATREPEMARLAGADSGVMVAVGGGAVIDGVAPPSVGAATVGSWVDDPKTRASGLACGAFAQPARVTAVDAARQAHATFRLANRGRPTRASQPLSTLSRLPVPRTYIWHRRRQAAASVTWAGL
jgi:hypothetical protein